MCNPLAPRVSVFTPIPISQPTLISIRSEARGSRFFEAHLPIPIHCLRRRLTIYTRLFRGKRPITFVPVSRRRPITRTPSPTTPLGPYGTNGRAGDCGCSSTRGRCLPFARVHTTTHKREGRRLRRLALLRNVASKFIRRTRRGKTFSRGPTRPSF